MSKGAGRPSAWARSYAAARSGPIDVPDHVARVNRGDDRLSTVTAGVTDQMAFGSAATISLGSTSRMTPVPWGVIRDQHLP